jgi:hypothetical protein
MTDDAEIHLLVDGAVVRPRDWAGTDPRFAIPAGARAITIRSRSAVPADSGPGLDVRRLGVHVTRIVLVTPFLRLEIIPAHPALTEGWHGPEGEARWTVGAAVLPGSLFAWIGGAFTLSLQLARTRLRYPLRQVPAEPPAAMPARTDAPRPHHRKVPGHAARQGIALLAASGDAAGAGAFIDTVLPFARLLIPGLLLTIYRPSAAAEAFAALAGEAVAVADLPEDPAPALDRHRGLAVPPRTGAAGRALLAGLANGIPVIAAPPSEAVDTPRHEHEILIAADPTAFAMAIARLEGDAPLWTRLSQGGLAWVAARRAAGDSAVC